MSAFFPNRWFSPGTVDEVVKIMEDHPGEVLLFGGGTYVHELRERGSLQRLKVAVDLQALGLNFVEPTLDGIKFGAMVRINDVIGCDRLRAPGFETLTLAAYAMGPDQIKNAATLGGAVACGVPIIDIIPALIALKTKVAVRLAEETRIMELGELLEGPVKALLGRSAIITEFFVPYPPEGSRSHFRKFRRSASDWAIVNASASIRLDSSRRCSDATLVIGSRPEGYFTLTRSAQSLIGKPIDDQALAAMKEILLREIRLQDHFTASAEYKRSLSSVFIRDAILGAAGSKASQTAARGGECHD
jgi:xanthine dehydrogenase small subunit